MQYQDGQTFNSSALFEAGPEPRTGTRTALLGTMGNLLSLNFDIVSTFGYQFALQLNLDLSTNRARVLADTTLVGLSDQEINFQNTETFRYREIEVDEDGKTKYTGVTREITAGLDLQPARLGLRRRHGHHESHPLHGLQAGHRPVRPGGNRCPRPRRMSSARRCAPPPGSLWSSAGIIRQEKSRQVKQGAAAGRHPRSATCSCSQKDSTTNTELVIYIVPHLEYSEPGEADSGARIERLYRQFAGLLQP